MNLAQLAESCSHSPVHPLPGGRTAAVALMFADGDDGLELCFVKRQEYPGDPWSGQMALPGGKRNPEDATPHDVAVREAHEEVGVTLHAAQLLGMMPGMSAGGGGRANPLTVFPVLYRLQGPGPPLTIGDELTEGHWISVAHLWDDANWSTLDWHGNEFPGIAHGERIIWGFTLGVLRRLGELAERPLNR